MAEQWIRKPATEIAPGDHVDGGKVTRVWSHINGAIQYRVAGRRHVKVARRNESIRVRVSR